MSDDRQKESTTIGRLKSLFTKCELLANRCSSTPSKGPLVEKEQMLLIGPNETFGCAVLQRASRLGHGGRDFTDVESECVDGCLVHIRYCWTQ
jgi:hypothetical protein